MRKNKILIATDGSTFGIAAVEKACTYIKPETTSIQILCVAQAVKALGAEPAFMSAEFYRQYELSNMKRAAEIVEDAAKRVRRHFPTDELDITTKTATGIPDQEIIARSKKWHANLIVVGSHGYGFWGRLLGSISDGVVHHAPCSVMVVKNK